MLIFFTYCNIFRTYEKAKNDHVTIISFQYCECLLSDSPWFQNEAECFYLQLKLEEPFFEIGYNKIEIA